MTWRLNLDEQKLYFTSAKTLAATDEEYKSGTEGRLWQYSLQSVCQAEADNHRLLILDFIGFVDGNKNNSSFDYFTRFI